MTLFLFLVLLWIVFVLSSFCYHLEGEEKAGCFSLFAFLMSYSCYCSVALLRGAMGCSAVFKNRSALAVNC